MKGLTLMALGVCLLACPALAQSIELFGGQQRATQDVMFFRPFPLPSSAAESAPRSNFLFFSRARVSAGYQEADHAPQFGLTSAVSYNHPSLVGFAPVVVGQAFNRGVFPKAGVQYAHVSRQLTVFTWVVSETLARPSIDHFVLARYALPLSELLGLFLQCEVLSTFPTYYDQPFGFAERARLGLAIQRWQLGPGIDLNQTGRTAFAQSLNIGGFARFEL